MCRFFAHLCLYLRMIDISVPTAATQVILELYLRVLEVRVFVQIHSLQIFDPVVSRVLANKI